jgi:ribonuclease D
MNGKTFNLKSMSAYWCNSVVGDYENRFFWSRELVDDHMQSVSKEARLILETLAHSAPSEYAASYFAAGPLEDYVNLIARQKDEDEASYILSNESLNNLLQFVWGDVGQLRSLAKKTRLVSSHSSTLESTLTTLTSKEVAGFWCKICASPEVTEYDKHYQKAINALLNKQSREQTMQDLLISAPDKKAELYLETNIFVLHS